MREYNGEAASPFPAVMHTRCRTVERSWVLLKALRPFPDLQAGPRHGEQEEAVWTAASAPKVRLLGGDNIGNVYGPCPVLGGLSECYTRP